MQLTKFLKLNINHTPGKNLSVADMLSRSFTKAELQINQLKHKQLLPQIDFAILQNSTLSRECSLPHNTNSPATNHTSSPNIIRDTIRICLPFRMFRTVFNKLHEHSHTGINITFNTFSQYYCIPYLEKWLSIFIHDCIVCQRNKPFIMKSKLLLYNPFPNMLFQLPNFYGYKMTYQPSFIQQILH